VHIDWLVALAALFVGFTVGLTGMGGGALMTPILVLLFNFSPSAAVSSDLVAAMVMKPIGGGVHIRRRTVHWELVKWLCVGSVPCAFAGVFILRAFGDTEQVEETIKTLLGTTLLLAAGSMIVKAWLQGRRTKARRLAGVPEPLLTGAVQVKAVPTVLVGALGGLLVGLTSVGSGSIVIVCLMLLYPHLKGAELVGTDLAQAIPLVTSAALAHIIFGDFVLGLTVSILVGSIPGVYVGARMSAKAPDGVIRPALVFVLVASSLKLLDVSTGVLGGIMLGFALIAFPIWGAFDAASHPERHWEAAGVRRSTWILVQALGAVCIVGFAAAIAYFATVRPRLQRAGLELAAPQTERVPA